MKVIDLLNKIAKEKEVPKKIRYDDEIYEYHDKEHGYCRHEYDNVYVCLDSEYYLFDILNDEVEIIGEEKKIPKKLENYKSDDDSFIGLRETINVMYDDTSRKINEIIDYLEKNKQV